MNAEFGQWQISKRILKGPEQKACEITPEIDRIISADPIFSPRYATYSQLRQKLLCYELALFITRINIVGPCEPTTYITADGRRNSIRIPSPEDHLKGVLESARLSSVWSEEEMINWLREQLAVSET